MNTLWVVGAGVEAVPGIQRAKDLGLFVVVSDGDPDAPGFHLADDHVVVSIYDIEGTVDAAWKYHGSVRPLDGVICIAADVPLTVAAVAEKLRLPGIPVETARLSVDKVVMKEHLAACGIPVPWFCRLESLTHLRGIVKNRFIGHSLVIKPVDNLGSCGVLRLLRDIDLEWAFDHAMAWSPNSQVMIEEYLQGPQISTESVFLDGVGFTPGFSDRNYEFLERFSPFVIENGGQLPSMLSADDQKAVASVAEQAAKAMGITTGIAKGDIVLALDGPKVIEMAPQLSGGWFCTDQIPLATGVDLVGVAIKLALGQAVSPSELIPTQRQGVAIRYFFPTPGRVVGVKQAELWSAAPGIHRMGFFVHPNDRVESVTNHTQRAGFVIATGETRAEAIERADQVVNSIQIDTVPA